MLEVSRGVRVRDVMVRQFLTLEVGDPIERAVREVTASHQKDLPVASNRKIMSILLYRDIVKALS